MFRYSYYLKKSAAGLLLSVFFVITLLPDALIAADAVHSDLIHTAENVVYNSAGWQGVRDLSFKYQVHQKNDTVVFIVTVMDNKIIAKPGNIVSDHVEIRIADPALVWTTTDRGRVAGKKEDVLFIHAFPDVFTNFGATHFIVSPNSVIMLPQRCSYVKPVVEYRQLGDTMYIYRVSVPLYGNLDMLTDSLSGLSYLIDVVDVDSAGAPMMKCCMSSSPGRIFSSPNTFNQVTLTTVRVEAPSFDLFKRIQPVGAVLSDSGRMQYWGVTTEMSTRSGNRKTARSKDGPAYELVKCRRDILYADSIISIWKCFGVLGFTDSLINYVIKYSEKGPRPRYQLLEKVRYAKHNDGRRHLLNDKDAAPLHGCWKPVDYGACAVEGIEYMRIDTAGVVISTEAFDIARCPIPDDGLIEKMDRDDGAYVAFLFDNLEMKIMQRVVFMKDYPELGSVKVTLDTNL